MPDIAKPGAKRLVLAAVAGVLVCVVAIWAFHCGMPDGSRVTAAAMVVPMPIQTEVETTAPVGVVSSSAVQSAPSNVTAPAQSNPVASLPLPPPPMSRPTAQVKNSLNAPFIVAKDALDLEPLRAIWTQSQVNGPALHDQLLKVPEVTLVGRHAGTSKLRELSAKARHLAEARNSHSFTRQPDGFIRWVKDNHMEVAGMPFILGDTCQLPRNEAANLRQYSLLIRDHLQKTRAESAQDAGAFWERVVSLRQPEGLPALLQILGPAHGKFKEGLIEHLVGIKDARATQALAKMALFDPRLEVRAAALAALRERNPAHYRAQLLDGFRHPWAPVAHHAAQAVDYLQRTEWVPDLIGLLDAPDPSAPFEDKSGEKLVREMVRVNHHRNCMLCHSPADAAERREFAVAIPTPDSPLPPSFSSSYYNQGSGLAVRPDITYLRQDFSVMQHVRNADPWPEMQRFDFVVRTRPATRHDFRRWAVQKQSGSLSEQRQAMHWALHRLTGKHVEPNAAAWRRAIYRTQ